MSSARQAVYAKVTDAIMGKLREGVAPWHKPWSDADRPRNFATGRAYSGINAFALGLFGPTPYWLTFNQARLMDCQVRQGAKGVPILFYGTQTRQRLVKGNNGAAVEDHEVGFVRYFHVFNAVDVDGIDAARLGQSPSPFEPIEVAQGLLSAVQPTPEIRHGGDVAAFNPARDVLRMPRPEDFARSVDYYAILFHELTHWTGHQSRLDRESLRDAKSFGDESYSREELVAQMGAGFLCALTGIQNDTIEQSASYLDNWLKQLQNDRGLLISAASQAQRATDYLTRSWTQPAAIGVTDQETEATAES
ncbi:MAG: zincin-like metallopeptidase domain-containing protein [bacterium]